MPLKKKLIRFGRSRAIIIPADWLAFLEEQKGRKIDYVLMEVNDEIKVRAPAS